MLADAVEQMASDGVRRALAFVTSAYASYYGCRQYLEAIERACAALGAKAPQIDKLRLFYNHPGFIEPMCEHVEAALDEVPAERRDDARLVFTAHSIPTATAAKCAYESQLREACRLMAERVERPEWQLVFQSRSGPPSQPWLEPSVTDHLRGLAGRAEACDVILAPIGFLYENMEIVYDLDVEAAELCEELGVNMVRAAPVGAHPRFARMIRELVLERMQDGPTRLALGDHGPSHDVCPPDCCPRE
jgi:ferrochelatase